MELWCQGCMKHQPMSPHAYDLIFCLECGTIRVRPERLGAGRRSLQAQKEE